MSGGEGLLSDSEANLAANGVSCIGVSECHLPKRSIGAKLQNFTNAKSSEESRKQEIRNLLQRACGRQL